MKYIFCLVLISFFLLAAAILLAEDMLNVSLLNRDGAPAGSLEFPGREDVTTENPWIISSQHLYVVYSCIESVWGIRIVTDNEADIGRVYPKPLNEGPDNTWEWDIHPEWDGRYMYSTRRGWLTGDDSVSFQGLIDPETKDNPLLRADLAWQVYPANPPSEPIPMERSPDGWNVGGDWDDDWVYIIDKGNRWNGRLSVGDIFDVETWNPKYEIVLTGNEENSYLTQHPPMPDNDGDGERDSRWVPDPEDDEVYEIIIYIGACFGVPSDEEEGEFDGILPAGNYTSKIYLELLHE